MTVTGRRRDRLIVARSGFQSSDGPLRAEPDRELAGTFPRKDPDHVAAHGIVDCFQQPLGHRGRHAGQAERLSRVKRLREGRKLAQGGGRLGAQLDLVDHPVRAVSD